MESYFIEIGGNKLHYYKSGQGKEILLAFHGFGQDHHFFTKFSEVTKAVYTVYSFDIFFHGQSSWKNCEEPLSINTWIEFVTHLLWRHQINYFSLLGYSLGGKFAMITLSHFSERVEKLILIAPDGVKTNFWYSLATYPYWIRRAFRASIVRPGFFFFLVKLFGKLNILDKGIARFAKSQMNSRRKRYRVYCTWMVLRKMRPVIKEVAGLINLHSIVLEMYLGKYDRIIRENNMQRLLKKVKRYDLTLLETGHNTLIDDVAAFYQHKNKS